MALKKILAALLVSTPCLANAATVAVTLGEAGAMEADLLGIGATGVAVETFDNLGTGHFSNYASVLGTYSAGQVDATNQFGGADGSQYLFSENQSGSTLTLHTPATYFGLWWSAGSWRNQVELFSGGTSIFSFNTDDVLEYLSTNTANSADYYGNPSDKFKGRVPHEPFVFLNMFSDTAFDTVVLSGPNFESDNHTVATTFAQTTGTNIAPVPLPAALPLLAGAIGGLAFFSRRLRKRA